MCTFVFSQSHGCKQNTDFLACLYVRTYKLFLRRQISFEAGWRVFRGAFANGGLVERDTRYVKVTHCRPSLELEHKGSGSPEDFLAVIHEIGTLFVLEIHLPLFTNAPSKNYFHVVELHLEKLLWMLHGASLEGRGTLKELIQYVWTMTV